MKSWDKRLTGRGSGNGFLYGVGLLCGIGCRCVDPEEFLYWTPHFCFALHGVVRIFIQLWYADEAFIYYVIYSFTLCAAERKVGERANSMKYRTYHLIHPCLSADKWFSSLCEAKDVSVFRWASPCMTSAPLNPTHLCFYIVLKWKEADACSCPWSPNVLHGHWTGISW